MFSTYPKVYIHNDSASHANKKLKNGLKNEIIFYNNDIITFKDISVVNFTQSHDSKHCCGFSIKDSNAKVSISTDIGVMNNEVLSHLLNSNLVYLEANHDEHLLLDNPNYPAFLKQRILGRNGHLSNKASAETIKNLATNNVSLKYDASITSIETLAQVVSNIGFQLVITGGEEAQSQVEECEQSRYNELKRNATWAIVLSLPIVLLSMVFTSVPFSNVMMRLNLRPTSWSISSSMGLRNRMS